MGLTRIDYLFGAFAIVMAFAAKYLAVDTEFFVLMGTIIGMIFGFRFGASVPEGIALASTVVKTASTTKK